MDNKISEECYYLIYYTKPGNEVDKDIFNRCLYIQ